MLKPIKLSVISLLLFSIFLVEVTIVAAADTLQGPTESGATLDSDVIILGKHVDTGSLNGFLQLALAVASFILGLVGALALAAFIYGGIMWLISAGNAERVDIGKKSITGAVVGLAIVFTSYMIIQLVFTALGVPGAENGKWATSGWTSIWR